MKSDDHAAVCAAISFPHLSRNYSLGGKEKGKSETHVSSLFPERYPSMPTSLTYIHRSVENGNGIHESRCCETTWEKMKVAELAAIRAVISLPPLSRNYSPGNVTILKRKREKRGRGRMFLPENSQDVQARFLMS